MLVLSRQRDESIIIICPDGTEIIIKVVDIRWDKIRLGFDAPKAYLVHRVEVWKEIKRLKSGINSKLGEIVKEAENERAESSSPTNDPR